MKDKLGNPMFKDQPAAPQGADDWIVIGVSGVTCGGKTTLANRLKDLLVPSYVFHQDKYFYPDDSPRHVKCEGLDHNNYDILSSLDMDLMYQEMLDTIRGADKSHASNTERTAGKYEAENKKFLIVEGFTALNFRPIMEICHLRYYLVLPYEECVARRARRRYEPADVPGYFERCVWPEHRRYRAEIEEDGRAAVLDGRRDALAAVLADLRARGARPLA